MRLPPDDREIVRLAVPALGALICEPVFLLVDTAIVGSLGTTALAALGVASAILATAVNTFAFLAYATTASVARLIGASRIDDALARGVDGLWLGAGLGLLAAVLTGAGAPVLVGLFHPAPAVFEQAVTYLHWAAPGIPAMLVVLAATGVLRGLRDTRTPLVVAASGALANALLNLALVRGAGLGIAGSGIGTSITQLGMGVTTAAVVGAAAGRRRIRRRPNIDGIRAGGTAGFPLFVRTVALRASLLLTTYAATRLGVTQLAAHQVVSSLWNLLALTVDALAIAGQAITGGFLGAGDVARARAATTRLLRWGVLTGIGLGLLLLAVRALAEPAFTTDPGVRRALGSALVVAAVMQPLAGYVFVLDGVLIGAGDGRFLALSATIQLLVYAPFVAAVLRWAPPGTAGLVWLWIAFAGGWMAVRGLLLHYRAGTDAWLVTGLSR